MAIEKWSDETLVFRANSFGANEGTVAALPNGGYVVCWYNNATGTPVISIQVFDAAGRPTSQIQSVASTVGSPRNADIVVLKNGSFVVTWSGASSAIQGYKFAIDGTPVPGAIPDANAETTHSKMSPALATDGNAWVSVWADQSSDPLISDSIKFLRHDGSSVSLNATTGEGVANPDVAELSGGGHVVTWQQGGKIKVAKVSGNVVTDLASAFDTAQANGMDPSITSLSTGGFVVTWRTSTKQIGTQVYDAQGNKVSVGSELFGTGIDYEPHIVALTKGGFAGGYAIIYTAPTPGDNGDIFLRLVKADGTIVGPTMINDTTKDGSGQQVLSSVTELPDGRLSIVWDDGSGDSRAGAIRNKIIDAREIAVTVNGTAGADYFVGTKFGGDILEGLGGNDRLEGGAGGDQLRGGDGIDTAAYEFATSGVVANLATGTGSAGDAAGDTYTGIENLEGSAFGDSLTGDAGANRLIGAGGNDVLAGGAGADRMEGGIGNDVYYADAWDTIVEAAGQGYDTVYATTGFTLTEGAEIESIQFVGWGAATLVGNSFSNALTGGAGSDNLSGAGGDDVLNGGAGADFMDGGVGNDTYYVDNAGDIVSDSGGGVDTVLTSVSFTLSPTVENLTATGVAPIILTGNAFANTLTGNAGANKLYGKLGNDVLTGGSGKDIFVFDTKPNKSSNKDRIVDFNVKDDSIHLDNKYFKKLGKGTESKPGKLNKDFFTIGTKAKDKNDYLVYDNKKGVLYYDADGSSKGKAVEIANLSKKLKMTYKDFFII